MTPFAAVVLAHADPPQVRRLIAALDDVPVFLHCDAKTPGPVVGEMVQGLPDRVTLIDPLPTSLASWSLVAAELQGLRAALERTSAEHIAVLSGSCHPLLPVSGLVAELSAWAGRSWIWNQPMPFPRWDTPRHRDGGLWRVRHRFLTRRDQVLFVRGVPLRWPVPRAVPAGLELRASSQWKVYARHHVELLLRAVDTRPELMRFWRSTLVPEESFAASMLASPSVAGADALPVCAAHAWYIQWPEGGGADHPDWLDEGSFDRLAAAGSAPRVQPEDALGVVAEQPLPGRRLFARKFSSRRAQVLDRIDAELRTTQR